MGLAKRPSSSDVPVLVGCSHDTGQILLYAACAGFASLAVACRICREPMLLGEMTVVSVDEGLRSQCLGAVCGRALYATRDSH